MQVSDEEALSAPSPPASKSQSRARGSLPPLAGHQPLGPDDDTSANEGRGTPRDTTEGLDQDTLFWSDHSDPYHTTLGLSSRVSEPKGGIDVLEKISHRRLTLLGRGPRQWEHLLPGGRRALPRWKSHQDRLV